VDVTYDFYYIHGP